MQSLLLVLHSWLPRARNPKQKALLKYLQPSYIAVDLGLSSNYHDIIYQAILVQDNFFEDKRRSYRGFSNKGARIAEGDRYDELCWKAARANLSNASQTDSTSVPNTKYSYLDNIRRSLGYPFHDHYSAPVQVIITGEYGMDKSTECEHANVASLLWSRGISCDYTAQSGLMMSLLKLFTNDIHSERLSFEWRVDMICGHHNSLPENYPEGVRVRTG
eukprot:scaffold18327_cov44-Cyclotella_meneghiniana.AAC.2